MTLLDIFSGWLLNWDYTLFEAINQGSGNQFFDALMPIWREKKTWIPLYILISIIAIYRLKKKAVYLLLFAIICVTLGDVVSSHIIKPFFDRVRPCHNPELLSELILRNHYCPENGSFTSSHATNHFALAIYLFVSLKQQLKYWVWLLPFWALVICYAQIYVGIHYPSDVIAGGILGSIIGIIFSKLYIKTTKNKRIYGKNS